MLRGGACRGVQQFERSPLAQPRAGDHERYAETTLDGGEHDRARRQGAHAALVNPERLGDSARVALREEDQGRLDVPGRQLPPDELAERTGGAAGSERGLGERRGEAFEEPLHLGPHRGNGPLGGRVAERHPLGEPHGACVERPLPGGAAARRPDHYLCGPSAHVADGDALGQPPRGRDGPEERQPPLLFG